MLKPSRYEAFILNAEYIKVVFIFNLVCVTTRYSASRKLFILESLTDCVVQIHLLCSTAILYIVGNKAKGRISKRVFQESKARQNFRKKKNISYPPDTHTFFALLPTTYSLTDITSSYKR